MKISTLLAFATAALFAAGPALAGPNCRNKDKSANEEVYEVVERDGESKGKCNKGDCDKNKSAEEGVYEVADREGKEGERAERPQRGEKGEKGERSQRRKGHHGPLHGLELSDDQKEQVKEIMSAAKEQAMAKIKAAKESGERPDREEMMAIRKDAMQKVYITVLNDEQKAKVDERRKKMEERRAEREKSGEGRERPSREGKGGERPQRSAGSEDLDL